jgi:hypothetical protein
MFLYLKNSDNQSPIFKSILQRTNIELNAGFTTEYFNSIINEFSKVIIQHIFEDDHLKVLSFYKTDGIKKESKPIRYDHILEYGQTSVSPSKEQIELIIKKINETVTCVISYKNKPFSLDYKNIFLILKGKELKQIYYKIFINYNNQELDLRSVPEIMKKFSEDLQRNFEKNKLFFKDIFDIFDKIFQNNNI